jgi:hypothetical protein
VSTAEAVRSDRQNRALFMKRGPCWRELKGVVNLHIRRGVPRVLQEL